VNVRLQSVDLNARKEKSIARLRPIGDIFEAGEIIKILRKGNGPYDREIAIEKNTPPTKFRFTHK
jgi:hypothetical protein